MDLIHLQQVSSSPRSLMAVIIVLKEVLLNAPSISRKAVFQALLQSINHLEESCFHRHTCSVGKLVLMRWFFNQNTSPDVSIKKFLKNFEYERHETDGP
jgi:hypothetical protein